MHQEMIRAIKKVREKYAQMSSKELACHVQRVCDSKLSSLMRGFVWSHESYTCFVSQCVPTNVKSSSLYISDVLTESIYYSSNTEWLLTQSKPPIRLIDEGSDLWVPAQAA